LTPHDEVSRVQIWELTNGLFFSFKTKHKTKTEFQLFFFITLGKEERSSLKRREEERKKSRNKNPSTHLLLQTQKNSSFLHNPKHHSHTHTHTHTKEIVEFMLLNMFLFDTLPKQNKTKQKSTKHNKFLSTKQQVTTIKIKNLIKEKKLWKNIRGNNKQKKRN
jgi:hypothetical protein